MLSMLYRAPPILETKHVQHKIQTLSYCFQLNTTWTHWTMETLKPLRDGGPNSVMVTYPADNSREAMPTLSPRA